MKKKYWIILGAVVITAFFIIVNIKAKKGKSVPVQAERVENRDLSMIISASGNIRPKRQVDISASTIGKVTEVAVKHRERTAGTTKYGSGRLYRGFTDLISLNVAFKAGHSPFRFFLKFFNWVLLLGLLSWFMAIVQAIWDLEFLGDFDSQFFILAGLILIVQSFQFLAIAFGLEIMSKNSQGIKGPEYAISEEITYQT